VARVDGQGIVRALLSLDAVRGTAMLAVKHDGTAMLVLERDGQVVGRLPRGGVDLISPMKISR
jgi:hypothetical protein